MRCAKNIVFNDMRGSILQISSLTFCADKSTTTIIACSTKLQNIFISQDPKKRGTPNPVVDHHAASYPKWILTAMVKKSTTRQGGGLGVPLRIITVPRILGCLHQLRKRKLLTAFGHNSKMEISQLVNKSQYLN